MTDIVYLAVIVGFFAFTVALVRMCERIIGPDQAAASSESDDVERVAA